MITSMQKELQKNSQDYKVPRLKTSQEVKPYLGSAIDDVFLRMVENLEVWNDFPWGEHMWQELYAAIRNVNSNHKQAHHKALKINPNFVPTYSLSGFVLCFKIWILESSSMTDRRWSKVSEGIPRGHFWSKHLPFQKWEYFGQLFPQAKKPKYDLYPNRADAQSEWFTMSTNIFKLYTLRAPLVEYGGPFRDYLKKLSLARTLREKDRESRPCSKSSTREVTLKYRVKALEGLCSSLMILPKEIKSLKARVYKLETIIKVVTKKDLNLKHKDSTSGQMCDLDALDDLVDENGVVEVDKHLSHDDCVKTQKLNAEINRVAEHRRLRLQLRLEEENNMKSIDFSKFTHMKLSLSKCGTNKRRYVNVLRPPIEEDTAEKVLSMDTLKKQNNVLDEFMIERCQDLKPWEEFPWCNEIVVDRHFWDSLIGFDNKRLGWLVDDHIELWVWYMWHFRQLCHDWSMVSCYFLTLLLQDSMSLFYATDEIYPLAWRDVEQFHIQSGNVTLYDIQKTYDVEYHPWYVKMRSCLATKLLVVLQQTGVFASKRINPTSYSIMFSHAQNIPKQGRVFGDYGMFVCLILYRLDPRIPLDVEDPIQTALAYREKMVKKI
ncbi:hypothetical protein Tco_1560991 [Tanacetum coccineum]